MKKILMLILLSMNFITFSRTYDAWKDLPEEQFIGKNNDKNFKREERLKNNEENYKKHKKFMDSIIGYWRNNGQMLIIGKDKDGYYMKNVKHGDDVMYDQTTVYKEFPKTMQEENMTTKEIDEQEKKQEKLKKLDVLKDNVKYILYEQKDPMRLWFDGDKFAIYTTYANTKDKNYDGFRAVFSSAWLTIKDGKLAYIPNSWKPMDTESFFEMDEYYKTIKNTPIEKIDDTKNEKERYGITIKCKNGICRFGGYSSCEGILPELEIQFRKQMEKQYNDTKHENSNFTGEIFKPYTKEQTKIYYMFCSQRQLLKDYINYELNKEHKDVKYYINMYLMYEPMRKMTKEEIDIYSSIPLYKTPENEKIAKDLSKKYKVITNKAFRFQGDIQRYGMYQQIEIDRLRGLY
jgi:hypothetical protein